MADQHVFLALLAPEQHRIRNLIRTHVDDPARRADVLQDVWLEAWKSYPKFRAEAAFGTWLYRIALNVIYLSYRRDARAPRLVTTGHAHPDLPAASEPVSSQAEKLYRAIAALKTVEKTIITAHLDGYSNPEIADITGLSANHVGVQLHRIRKQLSQSIKHADYG